MLIAPWRKRLRTTSPWPRRSMSLRRLFATTSNARYRAIGRSKVSMKSCFPMPGGPRGRQGRG
eukprot:8504037-Pyramimonas_sp.AAC.1